MITTAQRRSRLLARQGFVRPLEVDDAARTLVGLHASDPVTPYVALWARVPGFERAQLAQALYDERRLLRVLGMRRTLFVVPHDQAAFMQAGCTRKMVGPQTRRLVKMLAEQELVDGDPAAFVARVGDEVVRRLEADGPATARELREQIPELKLQIRFGEGKAYGGTVGFSTRLLFLLATTGRIVRGRPLGSWLSSQYRWAALPDWIGGSLPVVEAEHARAELLRRWLACYGPGTFTDLHWWSGWGKRDTRKALAACGAVEVQLEQGPGWDLPDAPDAAPAHHVALTPSLDPTIMAYKDRGWLLGEHGPRVFDRNGNAGPLAWVDGRVVGGWAHHKGTGEVRLGLLEDVGAEAEAQLRDRAAALQVWLGDTRISPRFSAPLDKELAQA